MVIKCEKSREAKKQGPVDSILVKGAQPRKEAAGIITFEIPKSS